MTALDRLIPTPRLLEIDRIDLAAPAAKVWEQVRHGALARSRVARALFALRTFADDSSKDDHVSAAIRIDDQSRRVEPFGQLIHLRRQVE